ncbi:hypothetical protein ABFA07_014668 [Porites harrisoni]
MVRLMLLLCIVASTVFISYAGTVEKFSFEDNPLEESNLEEAGKDVDQSADPTKKPKETWVKEWVQVQNEEDEAKNSKPATWVHDWKQMDDAKDDQETHLAETPEQEQSDPRVCHVIRLCRRRCLKRCCIYRGRPFCRIIHCNILYCVYVRRCYG